MEGGGGGGGGFVITFGRFGGFAIRCISKSLMKPHTIIVLSGFLNISSLKGLCHGFLTDF